MSDEVDAFARATRRSRRIKLLLLALLIASPFLYVIKHIRDQRARSEARAEAIRRENAMTPDEQARLGETIKQMRVTLATDQARYAEVMTHAQLAALQPSDARCSVRLRPPEGSSAKSYVEHGSIDTYYFGDLTYTVIGPNDPVPPLSLATYVLDETEQAIKRGEATRDMASRVSTVRRSPHRVLVVGETQAPVMTGDSYLPGRVHGRVFVYSLDQGRVVCTGELDAQNSPAVDIRYTAMRGNALDENRAMNEAGTAVLQRDLEVQTRFAIAANVRAVR